jgi:two-component system sensor histidine kinase KdpD
VKIDAENKLFIQIIDTGLGLSSEELPKLFEKFYRVPNSVKGGTGLGLSIVKGYIEVLNGIVSVKKNLPQGLIFEIVLPVEVSFINKLKNE